MSENTAGNSMLDIFQSELSKNGPSSSEGTQTQANTPSQPETEEKEQQTQEVNQDQNHSPESNEAPKSRMKEIVVTDETGKKRIKVDLNDEKKIEKYVSMAYGMRKFQAERDQLKAQVAKIEPEYKELKQGWNELESAYSKSGVAGIVNLLRNDPQGYEKHMAQEIERRNVLAKASPEERARFDLEEKFNQERKERERIQKQMDEYVSESRRNNEEAGLKSLEAQLSPSFEKYRFNGKLGDKEVERMYDTAVWNQVINQLKDLPEDAPLSSASVDKAFRDVSSKFRRVIADKVETGTKKAIAQKKMTAQEKASVSAVRPTGNQSVSKEFDGHMETGDTRSALMSIFKSVRFK